MRFCPAILAPLAFAVSASGQYFSEGWQPGKSVPSASAPAFAPGASETPSAAPAASFKGIASLFDMSNVLSSKPVASLFSRAGINITEKLEEAALAQALMWDNRIPLITDENFQDLIVNEELTPEEEKDRVWFLIISVTASQKEGLSKYADTAFDEAFNTTLLENDLPNVRWGRIDYLNVTVLTTKWSVWQAPVMVVLKDRGQTLRFYKPRQLRLNPEVMRDFLLKEGWEESEPWSSAFAPGGSREWVLTYFAYALAKLYNATVMIPRWLLVVITGGMGSLVINLIHKNPKPAAPTRVVRPSTATAPPAVAAPSAVTTTAAPPSSPQGPKKGGTRHRKSAKK